MLEIDFRFVRSAKKFPIAQIEVAGEVCRTYDASGDFGAFSPRFLLDLIKSNFPRIVYFSFLHAFCPKNDVSLTVQDLGEMERAETFQWVQKYILRFLGEETVEMDCCCVVQNIFGNSGLGG